MSDTHRPRRVSAEISWAGDPAAVAWVGARTIHQYWPLLSGYFRDILLPPQRRAEESSVSWTWREPSRSKPVSAAELAGVRKRLSADLQLFTDNLTRELGAAAGNLRGHGNVDELGAATGAAVAQLVASGDDALSGFVCRTESGLRVHSWGATAAGRISYPDTTQREIAGQVIPARTHDARMQVLLQTAAGEQVAEAQTDAAGAFRFSTIAAGTYRLRARARKRGELFPAAGLEVTVAHAPVSGLVLREEDDALAVVPRERRWLRRLAWGALVAALVATGVTWFWRSRVENRVVARAVERGAELNFSKGKAPAAGASEAMGKTEKDPKSVRTTDGAPQSRDDLEVAFGVKADVTNSTVAEEKLRVQPGSPSLPGKVSGTPSAAGPIARNVGGGGGPGAARGTGAAPVEPSPKSDRNAGDANAAGREPERNVAANPAVARRPTVAVTRTKQGDGRTDARQADAHPETKEAAHAMSADRIRVDGVTADAEASAVAADIEGEDQPAGEAETHGFGAEAQPARRYAEQEPLKESAPRHSVMLRAHRTWRVQRVEWQLKPWRDPMWKASAPAAGDPVPQEPLGSQPERVRSGLSFFGAAAGGNLRWTSAADHLSADEDEAEFAFESRAAGASAGALLMSEGGTVLAEVWTRGDETLLRIADGVRVEQWFALEGDEGERVSWRSASGGPLPRAVGANGRISIPLDGALGNGVSQSMAAIDGASGWALIGVVRVEAMADFVR